MRTDIRDSSKMLQRNAKTIRNWLEESSAAAKYGPPPAGYPRSIISLYAAASSRYLGSAEAVSRKHEVRPLGLRESCSAAPLSRCQVLFDRDLPKKNPWAYRIFEHHQI